MKRSIVIVAALLILIVQAGLAIAKPASKASPGSAAQDSEGQVVSRDFSVGPGQELSFDLETGGGVSITGGDTNIVSVKATLGGRDASNCKVDINQTGSGVEVSSTYLGSNRNYSTNIRFEVQVPRQFNVKIRSGGGGVSIQNLEGTISGTTGGGGIRISNAKGTVQLSTGGGGITVTNCSLDGSVSTGGGHVLIQGNVGNLVGSTGGGRVEYKDSSFVPVKGRHGKSSGSDRSGAAHIYQGGGNVHLPDVPNGADVTTGGGDITIQSGRGRVHATTGGGDIKIGPVDGSIEALTGGGRITATIVDSSTGAHTVRAVTGGGDVTITLPPDISAQFDIKLAYTNNSRQNYKIVSDFGIEQRQTDTWSSAEGTPRKYIYGTGTIGTGENRIVIRNVNGNVYIRRGSQ